MPILKCSGTGSNNLDCSVDGTHLTCDRLAQGVLICKDKDGNTQAIIGQNAQQSVAVPLVETKKSSLETRFDQLVEELYSNLENGKSNFNTLRDAYKVIIDIVRSNPDLALDMAEDIRTYAIKANDPDAQKNCDLISEIASYVKDPKYELDYADELAGFRINREFPQASLYKKLIADSIHNTLTSAFNNSLNQMNVLIMPATGIGKNGFGPPDLYINQLLTPSDEEDNK